MAKHLRRRTGLEGVKACLLREFTPPETFNNPATLATAIKSTPVTLISPRPIDEAIGTVGGVTFRALDEHLMVRALPGVFCTGEKLGWEASTDGYLLTACFACGRVVGQGVLCRRKTQ